MLCWMQMNVDAEVILLAEDDPDHLLLIQHCFKNAGLLNPVQIVRDGDEAVAYLQGVGKFANRSEYPLPTLVLLDLKLPKRTGFEVLEWIRQDVGVCALRVIVLTSSQDIKDVNRAYQLGANSFLVKPLDFREFVENLPHAQGVLAMDESRSRNIPFGEWHTKERILNAFP